MPDEYENAERNDTRFPSEELLSLNHMAVRADESTMFGVV